MKKNFYQSLQRILLKKERGQAIVLVAIALVGLVAMMGLVTDTGILFIEYGKLKRGVDAASIAAAQQYRSASGGVLDPVAMEDAAKSYLNLNQTTNLLGDSQLPDVNVINVQVHSCEDLDVSLRPELCNPDPIGNPAANRKLVKVTASEEVKFGFLRVIGIKGTTITTTSTGEAAVLDLILVMDTSGSMAYETDPLQDPLSMQPTEDPSVCNVSTTMPCQPMQIVKTVAEDFLDTLYFPYDRVGVVSMTSQPSPYINTARTPQLVLPLTSDKPTVQAAIDSLKVFQPRRCLQPYGSDPGPGDCLKYESDNTTFYKIVCPSEDNPPGGDGSLRDPESCNSSNVGGTLKQARLALVNAAIVRPEAFWVVVAILGGPANVSEDPDDPGHPYGYCPENTWLTSPWCRDRYPSVRHAATDVANYTNPLSGLLKTGISIYDADDYARDQADALAKAVSGSGVTIYTIGLGAQIKSTSSVAAGEPPAGEDLLQYIANTAGGPSINHGQYFYAPTTADLSNVFELIATNIATRISQ